MAIASATSDSFLYEQVEKQILNLIDSGVLKPRERVPSLRHMSKQARVSIATVMQAYLALERKGFIEARPKSGFFVKPRPTRDPTVPRVVKPRGLPHKVQVGDLAASVFTAAHSPGVVSLGIANPSPDLLPVKGLTRAMTQVANRHRLQSMQYCPPAGVEGLRRQIAYRCAELGAVVSPEDVLITNGASEALALSLTLVANPGDVIAVESPTYFYVLQMIERLGMLAVSVRTDTEHGMCLESLEETLKTVHVKAVLTVPNFNNPLGCLMPDESKRRMVEMLSERKIYLIEDDVYGDLHFDEQRPRIAKCYDEAGYVLTASAFSKTLAPGYRVGWLLPGRFGKEAIQLKHALSGCSGTLVQMAIAEYLGSGNYDRFMRKVRKSYKEQVAQMRIAIAKYFPDQTRVSRPRGGFVLWVELPKGIDGAALFDEALTRGVSFTPGMLFSPRKKFKNYIRVCAGLPWADQVEEAVATLGAVIHEMA